MSQFYKKAYGKIATKTKTALSINNIKTRD